jgi:hypothetical protein
MRSNFVAFFFEMKGFFPIFLGASTLLVAITENLLHARCDPFPSTERRHCPLPTGFSGTLREILLFSSEESQSRISSPTIFHLSRYLLMAVGSEWVPAEKSGGEVGRTPRKVT